MTSNLISEKVEQAIASWLRNQVSSDDDIPVEQIVEGLSHGFNAGDILSKAVSLPLPAVVIICDGGDHQAPFSGNWLCHPEVEVRTNADKTTLAEHMAIAAVIFNRLTTDTIKADLSDALDDFTAHIVIMKRQEHAPQGRKWVSKFQMEIECCGSDIS